MTTIKYKYFSRQTSRSGFTALCEKYSNLSDTDAGGTCGTDQLSATLNNYLGKIVECESSDQYNGPCLRCLKALSHATQIRSTCFATLRETILTIYAGDITPSCELVVTRKKQ